MDDNKRNWRTFLLISGLILACSMISPSALSRTGATQRPGDLDPAFGNGGRVITPVSIVNGHDFGRAVALQNDGKIVVAGSSHGRTASGDFALARYNPDGSLDMGFGSGGKAVADSIKVEVSISSIALQSDGKIIVTGSTDLLWRDFTVMARSIKLLATAGVSPRRAALPKPLPFKVTEKLSQQAVPFFSPEIEILC